MELSLPGAKVRGNESSIIHRAYVASSTYEITSEVLPDNRLHFQEIKSRYRHSFKAFDRAEQCSFFTSLQFSLFYEITRITFSICLPRDVSAERGDATVSCPSVCPSVCNVQVP